MRRTREIEQIRDTVEHMTDQLASIQADVLANMAFLRKLCVILTIDPEQVEGR